MIEYVWSVNIMVLLLLCGVGYGLFWIFTMDSLKLEARNIDLKILVIIIKHQRFTTSEDMSLF